MKGKEHCEDINVNGRIILKSILKNRIGGISLAGTNNGGMV